ncbi:hypothetical protein LTR09_002804 [Extremus antarcticus]|uniref:DUF6699 domain-containing protein n=1 Tax=Extremus antarcticus TaxID=702011 RepID=A0AAJ0GF26_9PEZI|nr:hypothetical protein LTR09_002804 [Extremus antarcticus]
MAAEVQDSNLQKVDSAISDEPGSPSDVKKTTHRRTSSTVSSAANIADLGDWANIPLKKEGVELRIAPETQKLNWKLNQSPATIDDKEALKKPLCTPMVRKVDLAFPLGLEVTARNLKGVTVKDALDAIYKQYKKKQDDELEEPYLAGFEWDKEANYQKFIVHQKKTGEAPSGGSKKKKNKGGNDEE